MRSLVCLTVGAELGGTEPCTEAPLFSRSVATKHDRGDPRAMASTAECLYFLTTGDQQVSPPTPGFRPGPRSDRSILLGDTPDGPGLVDAEAARTEAAAKAVAEARVSRARG